MKRWTAALLILALLLALAPMAMAEEDLPDQELRIKGDAYYDEEQDIYVLTEEVVWQSGALWFDQVRCIGDLVLEMDFYTGHGHETNSYGGADGICVAIFADGDKSGEEGAGIGFNGCGGYGVEIDTYYNSDYNDPTYNHIAVVKDTVKNHLCTADATSFTEDGEWHHLRIINRDTVLRVFVDGQLMLTQEGVEPNGQYQIGITAATGEGFNFHAVRNIVLLEARASDWIDVDPELVPADFPDDWTKPITRKEFAAVAVQVYEKLSGTAAIPVVVSPFTDTTDVEVLKAYNVGIVNGYGNGLYGPDDLLSREQCAAMLTRVFKRITIPGWTLEEDASFPLDFEQPEPFADDELISGWARNSVYFMVANGIINGIGNHLFAPRNTTPREEAIGYATASREQALVIATRMVRNLKQPQ